MVDSNLGQCWDSSARGGFALRRFTLQGFAGFPYYWLLGDPRIALQAEPPYQVGSDREEGGVRTLTLEGAPAGVLPVRIAGGAAYSYVEAAGVGAWEHAPFYNARLQMADTGGDRYLLVQQTGGEMIIRLYRRPPLLRIGADLLTASLDHTLIVAYEIALPAGILAALAAGLVLWQRRAPIRLLLPATLAGLGFSALVGLYAWARLGQATITSKLVQLSPLSLIGAFLLTASGALIALLARSAWEREAAMWVASFPVWGASLFGLGAVAYVNTLLASRLGTGIYNYALGVLPPGRAGGAGAAAEAVTTTLNERGIRCTPLPPRAAWRPTRADPPARGRARRACRPAPPG